ncbi:hypothetical protein ACTG9Q_00090 [Actinokineospora sp. 24-640]
MTQVTAGPGPARPEIALPVRAHDLLLALAGRLDDDALAEARELVAATEVDRALEFVVGCLVSGPIGLSSAEQAELRDLLVATHCDPTVAERVVVVEPSLTTRHRFVAGRVDGVAPEEGVAEAASRVLDVLPDIRAVWAVWRTTPAGAVSGPVPQRIVVVGIGPAGSAPVTAYRVQHALRRAGLTASVEVLREGVEQSDYHHTAVRYATEVLADHGADAPAPAVPSSPQPAPASLGEPLGPSWMEEPPADSLNDQELDLLRQLQEELARREQADGGTPQSSWQGDLPGGNHPFDWHEANTMVNGMPLQPPDQRP